MESHFGNFDQESPKILSFWQMTRERFESQKDDSISALPLGDFLLLMRFSPESHTPVDRLTRQVILLVLLILRQSK